MIIISTLLLTATTTPSVMSIVQTALLSGGILYLVVKHYLEQRSTQVIHNNQVQSKITDNDIESKKEFQQEIVYKSFDAYVEQNNKVMNMFTNQIGKLEDQLQSLEKTQISNYSQGDVIRREIQSLKNITNGDLKEIKGLLVNNKDLGDNLKELAILLQTAQDTEIKLTEVITKQNEIIENNK